MTTVMDCIERIPEKLQILKDAGIQRFAELMTYCENKSIKEVVFVASGTSYNSAFTTQTFFEDAQITTRFIYPNIFVHHTQVSKDALYVFISQGGETKLVYEALCKVQQAGCLHCSITADLASPIAQKSDISIEMGCGYEEFMYRTLGYSTTTATCYQLAMALGLRQKTLQEEQLQLYQQDFQNMISNLSKVKEAALQWYEQHQFSLMRKKQVMFAGTGTLWPVCMEADIKMMEMVPMVTRSFELEEFIHGPQNAFDAQTAFFLYGRKGEDDEKLEAIARFLKNEIGFCCIVGDLAQDEHDLAFEPKSRWFYTLEYVTIAQVLAYELAHDFGRDLHRPVHASIQNYVRKTL